jgi:hypothetical protein
MNSRLKGLPGSMPQMVCRRIFHGTHRHFCCIAMTDRVEEVVRTENMLRTDISRTLI